MNEFHLAENDVIQFTEEQENDIINFAKQQKDSLQLRKTSSLTALKDTQRVHNDLVAGFIALMLILLMANKNNLALIPFDGNPVIMLALLTLFLRSRIASDLVGLVYEKTYDKDAKYGNSVGEWVISMCFVASALYKLNSQGYITGPQSLVFMVVYAIYFLHSAGKV